LTREGRFSRLTGARSVVQHGRATESCAIDLPFAKRDLLAMPRPISSNNRVCRAGSRLAWNASP